MDLKGRKWQKAGEDCIMRDFTICTARQVLSVWSDQGRHVVQTEEEKSALMMVMVVMMMGKGKERPWCLWDHNFKMDIT